MLRVWRMSDTVGIAYSFCCTFKRLQLLCITWQSTHFPIFTLRDVKSDEPTQHAELSWSGIQQHQPDILNKHDVLSSRRDKITLKNQKAIAFFKFRGGFVKLLTSSTLMKKVPHCIGDRLSPLSVGHPWSGHLTLIYGTWAIFFSSKKNAGHFSSPEGDNTIIIGTRAFRGSASEVLCPFVGGNFRAWKGVLWKKVRVTRLFGSLSFQDHCSSSCRTLLGHLGGYVQKIYFMGCFLW